MSLGPHWIDPELEKVLRSAPPERLAGNALDFNNLPACRARAARLEHPAIPAGVTFEDRFIGAALRVRIYAPETRPALLPAMIWMHGGGMVVGRVENDNRRLGALVAASGCTAVSVDYRLAPEHPYPAPVDDCYTALCWLAEHAGELGVDASRIAVAGASAGGGLAAGTALLARDRGGPDVCFQLMLSPMLDHRCETRSMLESTSLPLWNLRCNREGWRAFLGQLDGAELVPPYASPACEKDLTGLPPAFLDVGTADAFRDEVMDFGSRLMQCGVPTELHVYPGAYHGFDPMAPDSSIARRAADLRANALRRAFHNHIPGNNS